MVLFIVVPLYIKKVLIMKIGDRVKQVVHPISGSISRKIYDEASDGFKYQVDYTDADDEESHRWFTEAELELDNVKTTKGGV